MSGLVGPVTIAKIKAVREKVGCSLTEAKDLVESNPKLSVEEIIIKATGASYRQFKFEIEYCSGKLELFECEATNWKMAWGKLGDHIRLEVDGLDSIANVGLC